MTLLLLLACTPDPTCVLAAGGEGGCDEVHVCCVDAVCVVETRGVAIDCTDPTCADALGLALDLACD